MSIISKIFSLKGKKAEPTEEEILQGIIETHDYSALPPFPYHQRAYENGTIVEETAQCPCCGMEVPYIYKGRFHGDPEFTFVCPWCISSGAAALKYHGVFCKIKELEDVPEELRKQVAERTPCFEGWREEEWRAHCGDMAEFLGTAGWEEIQQINSPELLAELTAYADEEVSWDGGKTEFILQKLDGEGSPRAYVFRCRTCKKLTGYYDYQE